MCVCGRLVVKHLSYAIFKACFVSLCGIAVHINQHECVVAQDVR